MDIGDVIIVSLDAIKLGGHVVT